MSTLKELLDPTNEENRVTQAGIDAETRANLIELVGLRTAKREDAKAPEGQALFDRLHTVRLRRTSEVLATAQQLDEIVKIAALDGGDSADFLNGERDALVDVIRESGGTFGLKPSAEIIEELAKMEADKYRMEQGLNPHRLAEIGHLWSYFDGAVVAYQWVLGQRGSLDHRSDPILPAANIPPEVVEPHQ